MSRLFVFLGMAALLLASPVSAQERGAVRHDFDFSTLGTDTRILVFRPRIKVGEQSTGGMFEPRADWTELARENIGSALDVQRRRYGSSLIDAPEPIGEDARLVDEYLALFSAVSNSIITYQFFRGDRLETKKADNREDVFDWSLGPGVAELPGADQADYALFISTEDHYGSTGRKALQILAAVTVGVGVTSGVHSGYAALIDLKTGNILWINADFQMGGDVREADGAEKRVRQLFEDFPLPVTDGSGEQ
ncbi:hypothetical protein [Alteriqipengyuania abyssalis]|uniref:hypothetical protein n=1 Tax=Alteriqipengyuania abyssalis TaxID=2860200 RepID=UPI002006F086|nr:hypothetical protein [Alteriqipengyuania abyssalis]